MLHLMSIQTSPPFIPEIRVEMLERVPRMDSADELFGGNVDDERMYKKISIMVCRLEKLLKSAKDPFTGIERWGELKLVEFVKWYKKK